MSMEVINVESTLLYIQHWQCMQLQIEQSGLTLERPQLYNGSNSVRKMSSVWLVAIYHFIDYHFQTDLQQVIAIILTALSQMNDTTPEILDAALEIAQFEKNLSQVYFALCVHVLSLFITPMVPGCMHWFSISKNIDGYVIMLFFRSGKMMILMTTASTPQWKIFTISGRM